MPTVPPLEECRGLAISKSWSGSTNLRKNLTGRTVVPPQGGADSFA
jgi:hypothetical protein